MFTPYRVSHCPFDSSVFFLDQHKEGSMTIREGLVSVVGGLYAVLHPPLDGVGLRGYPRDKRDYVIHASLASFRYQEPDRRTWWQRFQGHFDGRIPTDIEAEMLQLDRTLKRFSLKDKFKPQEGYVCQLDTTRRKIDLQLFFHIVADNHQYLQEQQVRLW
ncbi:hypothetical protein HYV86_06460 [Candidatus Woesearchaeota archaeon]|nr:hypothetical protein [Candidatus Woesearchaeota archaeon]